MRLILPLRSLKHRLWCKRCGQKLIAVLALSMLANTVLADSHQDRISKVKSAFIYNIAKFVTWPDGATRPTQEHFNICFYRLNFLGRGFNIISNKTIQGKPIKKKIVASFPTESECDVLLIPEMELQRFSEEQSTQRQRPILTIADVTELKQKGYAYEGVGLNLVRHGSSIGFEVHLEEVKRRGLIMSSELLKLSRIVKPDF